MSLHKDRSSAVIFEEEIMSSKEFSARIGSFVLCFLAALMPGANDSRAQAYPAKTIEWISHTSAGSGTDLFNRNMSGMLEKMGILKVPFIHSNRVGGNGVIAYQYVQNKK